MSMMELDDLMYLYKDMGFRIGQCLMNALQEVNEEVYHTITGTEFDCYYDDKKIIACRKKLWEIWEGLE